MRYLGPVAEYDEASAVTEPETGLTFGYLRYTKRQSYGVFVTVDCRYGYKQAITESPSPSRQQKGRRRVNASGL